MKAIGKLKTTRRVALAGCLALSALSSQIQAATLNVMQSEAPRSMDPGDQTATYTASVLDPMYEGLVRFTPDLKIEPALATAWKSDASGKVWTFTLRQGVKFHDGTPFNADAVVANFDRHLDVKRGLAASGRIRAFLASVNKVDDHTVEFHLKKVYPAFLNLLTSGAALMVSPTADKAGTLGNKADGTGPYQLEQYKNGEFVLEKKNPNYWGKSSGTDEIKWTWSSETSVMNMALQANQADVINPVPPQFANMLKNNPQIKLEQGKGAAVFWVALNTKLKPLDDVRVRQALNFATDKAGIVRAIMYGYASPANSPLAPVTPGYDKTLNDYPLNLDKAKSLLKEAGYPQGFSMNIAVQAPEARIAQVLQGMWAKVGVKLNVQQMESGVWSKAAFADAQEKAAAKTGAVLASWSSGVNGADLQLRPLYHTQSFAPASANLGFFSDPKVDKLIDDAASTQDDAARNALYVQAQQAIMQDAPQVMLYFQDDLYATRKNISGVTMQPGGSVIVRDAHKS
ncbi:peptide/nickel transport system substrate-binding protein [Paramixta manurensis]|uniref:Peptide/nickel transport system substrate-binding protein n=1 Tax=Paramixta manurensis TaxID=2740817 RepID=A0A6M8UCA2_9GAMM|nr:peptide/nickel transport system substrate-binding protein [Erwiniaceae bacterium PD-1]